MLTRGCENLYNMPRQVFKRDNYDQPEGGQLWKERSRKIKGGFCCLNGGARLTTPDNRKEVRDIAEGGEAEENFIVWSLISNL